MTEATAVSQTPDFSGWGKKPAEEMGRWGQRTSVVIQADSLSQSDLGSAVPQSPPRPISTHGPSYLFVRQRARRKQ